MSSTAKWASLTLLIVAFVFVAACERTTTYIEEVATPANCFECHNDEDTGFIVARANQWANSVHATGGNYERNDIPCADCHTSEGFISKVTTGKQISPENPGPIGCFTCHAPHTNGDLSLRTTEPVNHDPSFGGGVFDYGIGNLCARCHQARELSPEVAEAPDSTSITSSRWGPHHGPQSNMLAGRGGYRFADFDYENSQHTRSVQEGCPQCHMAPPFGSQAGGHQFGLAYEYHEEEEYLVSGCNNEACHGEDGLEDFDPIREDYDRNGVAEGVQTEILSLMEQLRTELLSRGFIDEEDLVVASSEDPLKVSEVEAGAILNFRYILEDQSNGIHNAKYAAGLLQSALDALAAERLAAQQR
jgi:hypothetical protein